MLAEAQLEDPVQRVDHVLLARLSTRGHEPLCSGDVHKCGTVEAVYQPQTTAHRKRLSPGALSLKSPMIDA
jgi:hypothetical protein